MATSGMRGHRGRSKPSSGRSARYATALVLTVGLLAAGAAYAFRTLYAAMAQEHTRTRGEGADRFVVSNPAAVRPPASAYDVFAHDDAIWRARNAPRVTWWSLEEGPYVWHKPPRQVVTDSAYELTRTGHLREAAAVLDAWLDAHPADGDLLLDAARLHNSSGETNAAVLRYRQLLALRASESVRAELAAALLGAQRYDDAVSEYRGLLALHPRNRDYRLGLARSYVWGDHGRDAEQFLHAMAAAAPGDTAVMSLLRAARASFVPTAIQGERWVREDPAYAPYRLAFARALVSEGQPREAAAQFDLLVANGANLDLLREAAGVHGTAGDSLGAAFLFGRAVALAPENDSLRLDYAKALAWSGDNVRAIEQYGILIAHHPTAALLLTRGQLYVWRGDYTRGVADLRRSVAVDPSYDAFALLGDVARWQGRFAESRSMYLRALALSPNDTRVTMALVGLRRAEALYVASIGGAAEGWTTTGTYAEDNGGFLFLAMGVSAGATLDDATVVGVGIEQRRIAQRSARGPTRYIEGFAADARARRQFGARFGVSAYGGLARHALVHDIPYGGISVDWSAGGVSASLSLGSGPVYGSLMSMATLAPASGVPNATGAPVVGRTATATVSVPVGRASLTVSGERLELSDGNARNLLSAAVRVPLAPNVAVLYDGSLLGYARPSDLYWDPHRYATQSLGIEVTGRPAPGLTFAVRAMPGIGESEEPIAAAAPGNVTSFLPAKRAFQLSTGGELQYNGRRWDANAGAGYGRGREGSYQSLNGSIRVRVKW